MQPNRTRFGMLTTSWRYLLCVGIFTTIIVLAVTREHVTVPMTKSTIHYENIKYENPSIYLQSGRFDVIVKMVYAYFYVHKRELPESIREAYIDHLRVWNHFKEYCSSIRKHWFDSKIPCKNKRNQTDFITSFHKTIDMIKENGFDASISKIPLDNTGFLMNGAHRISAAVILSQNVSFEHHNYTQNSYYWDYKFFRSRGMQHGNLNMVVLEWMRIQMTLPSLKTFVSIVSVLSKNVNKDKVMRNIVKNQCSKDNNILYEVGINFTRTGVQQLFTHMYGEQPWINTQVKEMTSKFNSTFRVEFFFVYSRGTKQLVKCQNQIRKLYNDKIYNSTAHVLNTVEANLILAEMILNPNSIQFMNFAKNASKCNLIASEISKRLPNKPRQTLPGIFVGSDDVMLDTTTVFGLFGVRTQIPVQLIFLHGFKKELIGKKRGFDVGARAFVNNSISDARDNNGDIIHINKTINKLNLFYDPTNFGYCYGIKFISLKRKV